MFRLFRGYTYRYAITDKLEFPTKKGSFSARAKSRNIRLLTLVLRVLCAAQVSRHLSQATSTFVYFVFFVVTPIFTRSLTSCPLNATTKDTNHTKRGSFSARAKNRNVRLLTQVCRVFCATQVNKHLSQAKSAFVYFVFFVVTPIVTRSLTNFLLNATTKGTNHTKKGSFSARAKTRNIRLLTQVRRVFCATQVSSHLSQAKSAFVYFVFFVVTPISCV